MKKNSLFLVLLFLTTFAFAQFNVTDYDGEPILDGDVRVFSSIEPTTPGVNESVLYFWINNESPDDEIFIKIKLESITNADGSSYQFCFGMLCIFDVEEGVTYPEPSTENPNGIVVIPAGGTNPEFDKFQNDNLGDGNFPMDYVWKFFQVDEEGNEIGESITFTYRFDPNLSTVAHSLNAMGVTLKNTIGNNSIWFDSTASVNYQMFDLNGRAVQSVSFAEGSHQVGISQLTAGLYLLKFTDDQGRTATAKFVKK